METALLEAAKAKDIQIDIVSFIDTTPIQNSGIKEEIGKIVKQPASVVFTSMNAVNTVAAYINGQHADWNIFCIGQYDPSAGGKIFRRTIH